MSSSPQIVIKGARVNNLRNIDVNIPRDKFVVVTGVSGSGKSSLVYDTLFAEGQRRFAQSLSSYARQFLGRMTKPDVDLIDGIPPAIAIDQKNNVRNPRSTVATMTEIYDNLQLIFARVGKMYSPVSGREVKIRSEKDVLSYIRSLDGDVAYLACDFGWKDREDKVESLLALKEDGFVRLLVDGKPQKIEALMQKMTDDDIPSDVLLLLDRYSLPLAGDDEDTSTRVFASAKTAFDKGNGTAIVCTGEHREFFVNRFEADGIVFPKMEPCLFSFNSPVGACKECGGLGLTIGISEDLVVPDKSLSIYEGAIAPWRGEKMSYFKDRLISAAAGCGIPIFEPFHKLGQTHRRLIWEGVQKESEEDSFIGLDEFFKWIDSKKYKIQYKYMLSRYSGRRACAVCGGTRLCKEALWVKVGGRNIADVLSMNVRESLSFFNSLELDKTDSLIAERPLSEVKFKLQCLDDVGLGYLTLDRACNTLSGGESQRIRLVTALGSSLVGSMYILDEPSIGLHPRDTARLIEVLRRLRDMGNSVIVVEHDEEIMRAADVLIDMGPLAGLEGGTVVYQGTVRDAENGTSDISRSLTLSFLSGKKSCYMRPRHKWNYSIMLEGAMEHNLKDINVRFPLGVLTVVTGVSGSGKSSLVGDILYPALSRKLLDAGSVPGTFRALSGNLDRIDRVEYVDQNPIAKSSRSNAVTFLKIYDDIRTLLSEQQYARINGFKPSHFSFNQEGGRCPECQGDGFVKIGMQFMADVTMTCEACGGKRFKPEILEVRYKGKNVDDILAMSVSQAIEFFSSQEEESAKRIARRLQPLVDVGLSYITLGQSSSTLSGGESQRIKLAYFLSMTSRDGAVTSRNERILFIFDEPTTGLHFADIDKLIMAFEALISKGHTIIVVEHNAQVIRNADWIIDLGPEAGEDGGRVVYEGTYENLASCRESYTARYVCSNEKN